MLSSGLFSSWLSYTEKMEIDKIDNSVNENQCMSLKSQ